MKISVRILGVALALLAFMAVAGAGQWQAQDNRSGNHAMSITRFKVPAGEMANFLEMTKRANQIYEDKGSVAEARVWVENLAGSATGIVVHTKEYPSFEAMAADYSLVHTTDEWQAFLKDFNAADAEVVSNSLA